MLNFKRREEREKLLAQQQDLQEELKFAQEGKKPWGYEKWLESEDMAICDKHGEYSRRVLTGAEFRGKCPTKSSRCPDCIQEAQTQVSSGLRALQVAGLLDNAGIVRRFENCEFENYQRINSLAGKNLEACQRYAGNWPHVLESGKSLVLTGSSGTGKNHLAVSMAKNIIRNHLASVEITDVMRLTRAVKSAWRHNAECTEESVLEHYSSLDLLIVDEVGVQFGSPAEMTILHEIINTRYESVLPTILISNLPLDLLKEFISDRIFDRVTDGGRNHLVFNWPSFRANTGGAVA